MAMFAGSMLGGMGGSMLTPLLGMIPQAPGGPPNPFAPQPGVAQASPTSGITSLFSSATGAVGSTFSFIKSPQMMLYVGGAILVLVLLK